MTTRALASAAIALLGVCAGAVYVLGFTLLHESVDDALRGRIFSALMTVVRLCVLIAFALAPLLTGVLDDLSSRWFDDAASTCSASTCSFPGCASPCGWPGPSSWGPACSPAARCVHRA